ncbi:hypothetical protein [Sinomicrobium sp. M5D2P17]
MSTQQQNLDKYDQVFFQVREILGNKDYEEFNMFIDNHIKTHDIGILHAMLLSMHPDKENRHVSPKYNAVRYELKKRTNV